MEANSYDVTLSTFQQIIIDGSKNAPVLVVFWSPQSTACATLLPILGKLHNESNQAFTMARINCDSEPDIVSHFGVQTVPSVFMFVDGQGVDGFAGEQSEDFIRLFINKHNAGPSVALLEQGQTFFAQGKLTEAKTILLQAVELEPENIECKLSLAQVYLALGDHESANALLAIIPFAEQNMIYHNLMAQLTEAIKSAQTPELTALEMQLEGGADNIEIQYKLAIEYQKVNRNREALALLYKILSTDVGYQEGEAKKNMLAILATIDDATLISEYRRKLYSLLY